MSVSLSKEYWQDGGQLLQFWAVAMLAYWAGIGLVANRRPQKPARFDLFFIRWSFPVLFLPVTPVVMMGIWRLRDVKY